MTSLNYLQEVNAALYYYVLVQLHPQILSVIDAYWSTQHY